MCDVTRRSLLRGTAIAGGLSAASHAAQATSPPGIDESRVNQVDPVATDVYFHQGDIAHSGHCNNGWVIFKDYVLVIDANFPSGAHEILPKIRAITPKPIRFAFDTHHHGDHAYGNQVCVDNGATPVAHTGVIEEMKRYETGYYDGKPGRWEEAAKDRPDVKASHLNPPSVLFPKELYFDDGVHRVELIHLGVAHTHGDAVAWLPKERILFTGDTCVNGPYNFVGDGNVEQWIQTLNEAQKLGARVVCPGHGARGEETTLADQQFFFQQLRELVGKQVSAKKTPSEIAKNIDQMRQTIQAQVRCARYVDKDSLRPQVEKVYEEMTGQKFTADAKASNAARLEHARAHRLQLA
jgi:cyclase